MLFRSKPGLTRRFKNIASKEAPSTTSGVAIGRKIRRFVEVRPLNLYLPNANAIMVPNMVASNVEITPIFNEFPTASQTCGAPHGFFQFSKVKPCQTKLLFPALLKEKANRYTWEGRLSNLMLLKKPPKK